MGWTSGGVFQEELFLSLEATVFVQSLIEALSMSRFRLALTYYREGIRVARLRYPGVSVPGYIEVSLEGDPDDGWCIVVSITDLGRRGKTPLSRAFAG